MRIVVDGESLQSCCARRVRPANGVYEDKISERFKRANEGIYEIDAKSRDDLLMRDRAIYAARGIGREIDMREAQALVESGQRRSGAGEKQFNFFFCFKIKI